jgi:hypothetical protein
MSILWILSASLVGFGIAAIFAGLLKMPRNRFLLVYIPLVAALIALFLISNHFNVKELLLHNLIWGLAGAVVAGAFVIKNVYSQPSSPSSTGPDLFIDITWSGLAYGLIDALILSVLPILAVKIVLAGPVWFDTWYGKTGSGIIGLLATFFVTTAYHLGYPEFRGKQVIWPNIGNGVLSLAFILTMNPLAAILPHMAMHVAAMIHGKDTTGQVPPHYKE